ncbi:ABC transporter ATP-binding protein [Prochlorococcus sp. MIT 1307]|uniref:ABC transporter ATP-binding protein n=1 Tax=Prochlorococcus sp. MIT 1307 TaxID=3096219 RepID=UPI002A755246|nr:ABC transporter ATP-binding protein [Prochlorococcus sp. MIT 1307]
MFSQSEAGFRRLLPLLKPHKRNLLLGGCSMVVYVACWPILARLAGELIPNIGEGNLINVSKVITIALLVFLIQKLAQFAQDTFLAQPALKISQELRSQIFSRLQKVELGSLEKLSSGDIAYRLTEDADRVGEVIYKTIQDTVPCFLQLIAVFSYMIILDWQLSTATLFLAPLVTILVSVFGNKVMNAAEKSQKQVSELAGLLGEAIQGIPLVRAFAAEIWMQSKFNKQIELHRLAKYKTMRLLALQHPVVGFIEASGILAVFAIGAARIQSGGMNSQGFSSFIAALLMLIDPISHLTTNFNEFQQGQASLKRLREIENEQCEEEDCNEPVILENVKGELILKGVCFSYIPNKSILKNISLTINPGQVVALVGPSGAGKSTIFSLLLRFLRPNNGQIFLDGHDIYNLKSEDIRRSLALVPQRASVFTGSISDAISFGRKTSMEKIIAAAKIANAHEFIMELSDGYQTILEERGTNISGGQLQRIAIARAVLGNPAVMLLDEATSALDAEAEESVQLGLNRAMKGRTVLVIAHRLSTVQEADQIIVLDKGIICDKGSHDELIARDGRYKELCTKQLIRQ